MKDVKMKGLISDVNVLVYIHDLISLSEKVTDFKNTDIYKQLHERNLITIYKYLHRTRFTLAAFTIVILFLRNINISSNFLRYTIISIVSIIFGTIFIWCKEDIVQLKYQLKAKKAVQFALNNYSYDEYVLFLDSYLSEVSTKNYLLTRKINNH